MIDRTADASKTPSPTPLHDILLAWQRGALTARQAMATSGVDTIADLYGAARSSAVLIRKILLARERQAADAATSAIRARLAARATAGNRRSVAAPAPPAVHADQSGPSRQRRASPR